MSEETLLDGRVMLHVGNCLDVLRTLPDACVDSVVTDPPYHLTSIVKRFGAPNAAAAKPKQRGAFSRASRGFMGETWDGGDIAFRVELWAEVLRVLKPGGHCAAFSGTRTYHRMACAIEDAGFEIRDQLAWTYGSGFPKSHDVSKGVDRHNGDVRPVIGTETLSNDIRGGALLDAAHGGTRGALTRDVTTAASAAWQGWGTALKPAWEPICLARKPLIGTVAENVLAHGTGALNIDGCRIESEGGVARNGEASQDRRYTEKGGTNFAMQPGPRGCDPSGRWPANILHDGEADFGEQGRFFYTAKADAEDRIGSAHPTVKPVDLMQWLVRLVTPKGGVTLDLFAGTGTTGEASWREGCNAILIEREAAYAEDIRRRMRLAPQSFAARKVSIASLKSRAPIGGLFEGFDV